MEDVAEKVPPAIPAGITSYHSITAFCSLWPHRPCHGMVCYAPSSVLSFVELGTLLVVQCLVWLSLCPDVCVGSAIVVAKN